MQESKFPPKAFISYSWESDLHIEWVRGVAGRLVHAGVDVTLDQWQIVPGESLTSFMEGGVRDSNFVIVICTPTFARKADSRTGGVGYEQQIVSGDLLQGTPRSKFIPLLRAGELHGESRALPTYLSGSVFIDFRDDTKFEASLEELLRAIFRKRRFVRPVLGTPPSLPSTADPLPPAVPLESVREPSEKHCIILNDQLQPEEGSRAVLILVDEILDSLRRRIPFEVEVIIPQLRDTREALSALAAKGDLALEDRELRLELRRKVLHLSIFDIPEDALLSELIETVARQAGRIYGLTEVDQVAECVDESIKLFSPASRREQGTTFQIYPESRDWYTSFTIYRKEAEELANKEGVPVGYLIGDYGLQLFDFPSVVVRTKVIPALAFEYFRLKYDDRRGDKWRSASSVEEFFDIYKLKIGLA